MSATPAPRPARAALSKRKRALYAAVVVALFFGIAEGFLALLGVHPVAETEDPYVGFAQSLPLYVEEPHPDGSIDMVTARNKLAWFNPQRFPKPKPKNAFRIFTLGGSTTYGHPFDHRTAFSSWLQEILRAADPGRDWEVINAGGVSYASYRIASLMQELARYAPDLFIVYTGENEFLERRTYSGIIDADPKVTAVGALASRTRTYTAIRGAVQAARTRGVGRARKAYQMTGEVDAVLDAIGGIAAYTRDDTLARQVAAHYEFNMRRMVRIAGDAGARLVFVVPASNQRDCSPFKSEHGPGLAPEALARFDAEQERGREARERGDRAAAAAAFAAAAAIDPRHAAAQYELGRALLDLGRTAEAEAALQRAIDEDVCPLRQPSGMAAALRRLAREEGVPLVDYPALLADSTRARLGHSILGAETFLDHVHPTIEGHRLLAEALVEEMARSGLAHPAADWRTSAVPRAAQTIESRVDRRLQARGLRNVARVFNWAGKTEEAGRLARQAAELDPEDVDNLVVLGSQAAAEKRSAEAIAYYERALAAEPDQLEARNNLAAELARQGRSAEALRHYETILATRPDQWAVHANAARACLQLGRIEQAIEHGAKVVDLKPDDPAAHVQLGNVLSKAGRAERAAAEYRAALRLDPKSAAALDGLGSLFAQQGKLDSALVQYRAAVGAAPGSAAAYVALGSALWQHGDLAAAKEALLQALRLDPAVPEANNLLGLVLWRQGDLPAAIARFERELQANPTHPDAPANQAFILVSQGRVEEGIRAYRQALAAHPRDPKLLNGLAWVLATHSEARYRNGREALLLATRADSLSGHQHPVALNTLAAAYAEVGRFEDAVRTAERAVASARAAGQAAAARDIETLLEGSYRQRRPYREPARSSR